MKHIISKLNADGYFKYYLMLAGCLLIITSVDFLADLIISIF